MQLICCVSIQEKLHYFLSISLIQFSLTRCYFHHVRLNATFCFVLVYCNQLKDFISGVYRPHNQWIIGQADGARDFFDASHSARPSSVFNSSRSIPVKNNNEQKRRKRELKRKRETGGLRFFKSKISRLDTSKIAICNNAD